MKAKPADVELVGLTGAEVIVVSGAVVSTTQAWDAGEPSAFPAASVARTSKSWEPSPRPA